ncbi:TetR/AcrR family transcriptional regulator [Amycolatopsis acidiphila]|nr:TetR/AcrR family transcriptional regulator [Amycolatopsis acidiphila]
MRQYPSSRVSGPNRQDGVAMAATGAAAGGARQRLTAAERRAQLTEAAARRFERDGYPRVSLADVAADVGVTAPAVYRHFKNKQDLLVGAILDGLDLVERTLARTAGDSLEDLVVAMADLMMDRRYLWALFQREARFLAPESQASIRRQFDRVIGKLVRRLRQHRPELAPDEARLLITAATSALASPAMPKSVPRALVSGELAGSAMRILNLQLEKCLAKVETRGGSITHAPSPNSRRDELLESAIGLFFRRGYAGVSLDDIGASAGLAGPSLYHHFNTKTDILVAAFSRATERLTEEYDLRSKATPTPALAELVGMYTDFCLRNRELVGIYVSDVSYLPPDLQRQIRAVLRQRVAEWADAVTTENSEIGLRPARVRSHAALTVIDDLVRLGRFHVRPNVAAEIRVVAMSILTGNA